MKIDEYSPERVRQNKVIGAVAGVIWPIATALFLIGGFVSSFGTYARVRNGNGCFLLVIATRILLPHTFKDI